MPQPDKSTFKLNHEELLRFYDLHLDRDIGLGSINDEGWWNFERLSLFQSSSDSDNIRVEVSISAYPSGEFKIEGGANNLTTTIDNKHSHVVISGRTNDVN